MTQKSKYFAQFEYEFFRPIPPLAPDTTIFTYIDPWVISYLSSEEKQEAEELLLQALRQKIDERWLYGVRELKSEKGFSLLRDLFPQEPDTKNKIMIAEVILALDPNAPELNYVIDVIRSFAESSIKITALYILSHLLEVELNQKESHELILNTLFESMKDKEDRVRKCVYGRLIEHFNLRYVTPKNDPIFQLLENRHSQIQYKKAIQWLKKRIESKEIYPFSREKYVELVNEITREPVTLEPSSCEICKKFSQEMSADLANNEAIPDKAELEDMITLLSFKNCVKRCPRCGRLYCYTYHYMYYIAGQSEEEETLSMCTRETAIEMMDEYLRYHVSPRSIIRCGDFIVID